MSERTGEGLRAARHESGFWAEPPKVRGTKKAHDWGKLGVHAEITIGENQIREFPICYRQGAAIFRHQGSKEAIGIAHFAFMKSNARYDDDYYVYMMDSGTQESYEFAEFLGQHFSSIGEIFDAGRSVVEFLRLELLPDPGLRGLGVKLGWELMTTLEKTIGAAIFILEPYPLQFAPYDPDEVRDEEQFNAASRKLAELYARSWGAIPMDDKHLLCSPANRFERDSRSKRWKFAGRKA